MNPIITKQEASLRAAWKLMSRGEEMFILVAPGEFFVEGPDERLDGILNDEQPEAALRVFAGYEDAVRYCEAIRSIERASEEDIHVSSIDLEDLFGLLSNVCMNADAEWGCPAEVVLSEMAENEFPSSLDTLWSRYRTLN